MAGEEEAWVKQQKKTFTRWANTYMRIHASNKDIGDIYTDLKDGVKLIALLESLSGTPFPMKYNKKPKMDAQRQDNLKMVFKFLKDLKMPLVNIGAEDITKENHRIILALFWAFIQFYSVNSITLDGVSGKEGLLLWCKRQTAGYEGVAVGNFHRSWFDGKAFAALLHNNVPHKIDFEACARLGQDDCLERAFQVAEDEFNVPQIINVEDIVDAPNGKPDEKIVMTYLSLLYIEISKMAVIQKAVTSISQAVELTKKHKALAARYEAGAAELLEWIRATAKRYENVDEGRGGHGDTSVAIGANMATFVAYRRETKPPKKQELDALARAGKG